MALRLTDGTTITELREPPQGLKHRIFFGVEERSGREVAAKVELTDGALENERLALEWLTEQEAPAPRLRVAGTLDDSGEHPGAACLIVDRVAGGPTSSLAGWGRLGRALARLAEVPWEGSGLAVIGHDAFRDLHEQRVTDLAEALGRNPAAGMPPLPRSYSESPMTVTHSDPGPGNFLDDGVDGTLIDWEDAVVAPHGLDLGRARFIALPGVVAEDMGTEESAARADAVTAGFLAEVNQAPGEEELAWWLGVAGVQFAHWRLERAGAPGIPPWLDAVAALEAALPPHQSAPPAT